MARTKDVVYGTTVRIKAQAVNTLKANEITRLVDLAAALDVDIVVSLPGDNQRG